MSLGTVDIDPSELSRRQVTFQDDEDGRVYDHERLDNPVPSVTTVGEERVDPEKKEIIGYWKDSYDGTDDDSRPHHKDQLAYKGHRGTLAHYSLLSKIASMDGNTHFHEVGNRDWGYEEYYSQYCLNNWGQKAPSANDGEIPYTPTEDEYGGEDAYNRCVRGIDWCIEEWNRLRETVLDIDTVVNAEQYVLNQKWGYAGQYDLCYEQSDGIRVLMDFKTSSGIRLDYKIQLALYDAAMPTPIDRYQVVRIDPDDHETVVEDDTDWDRSKQGLKNEGLALSERTSLHRLPDFT